MNSQKYVQIMVITIVCSGLLSNCISSEALIDTPTPTMIGAVQTNTEPFLAPSTTPISSSTTSVDPSTATATVQSTVDPSMKWCDTFDDGKIDVIRWNPSTDSALIYEENSVLNFRVTEDPSREDEAWAGLEAKLTDKLIADISFTITLISYGENTPGGTGVDVFVKDAEPVFSVDVGPGPNGPGGEFSFCPDFNAGYEECQHPTPAPNKAAFPVVLGTPIDVHISGTGNDINFNIGNQSLASAPVNASIENFQFFIYADPGAALHATIDNACVTYVSN